MQTEGRAGFVRRTRAFVARHRLASGLTIAAAVALAIFVLAYFQPQKLFIDDHVNEALPGAAASGGASPEPAASSSGGASPEPTVPWVMAKGSFRSLEHTTRGTASLIRFADGSTIVRLEGFETSNGPDLFVLLSPSDGSGDDDAIARGALNLGKLKGNIGDQNYTVPAGTDTDGYRSVLIWCKRFTAGFGVATLRR